MAKTVLITGTSSGIGKQTALYFAERGWNVAATLRDPTKATDMKALRPRRGLGSLRVYGLDVTDEISIQEAIASALTDFGRIDVLVNNAGFAVDGVFEAMSDSVIEQQFNTNVFGLMRVTRAVIPVLRSQGGGTIIQIASMGGRLTFPLYSIYHASKWAVEGFSESLHYELAPFKIQVKLIEPGAIKTDFYGGGRRFVTSDALPMYQRFVEQVEAVSQAFGRNGESPELVARVIFQAASDRTSKMRYPVGKPAPLLLWARRWLPNAWFFSLIKRNYGI